MGYRDDPYLRIGPDGVYQNRRSTATYLNRSRKGTTKPPPEAEAGGDPVWEKVSSGTVARWHDHRIHWMLIQNPPTVRANPDQRHVVIPQWVIPMKLGSQAVQVKGDLVWQPASHDFRDPCDGHTYPGDGGSLPHYPTTVDPKGNLSVNLRTPVNS